MKGPLRPVHRIAVPIKSLIQRFAFVGLVVAAFGLMLLGKADVLLVERIRTQVTDALAPILDVLSRPVATVSEVVDQVRELASLREENAGLREDKVRLLQWQTVARRLEAENKALRALLKFVPGPEASYVTARVIGDTGGAFAHALVLNTGLRAGVRKGQAVVTGDGLVGRVAGVGTRSTRVILITDLNSHIPVLVERTRTRAILAGDNSEVLRLIRLPPGAEVTPGDRVVTSGHGGAFPPGLPVGVVGSVSDAGIGVQPFVERSRLEYVRVVDFGLRGILQPLFPGIPADGT
ncbi:MAG: rod shape-determining protein MreC [Rhodospirillales bacterium]